VPVNVFTKGSLIKVALRRRASSLEAVAHDLFEENQNLQESLEGEAKKRTKEGSKFFLIFFFINIHAPLGNAARGRPRRSTSQRFEDEYQLLGPTTIARKSSQAASK
jgi:hypothetical protein